MFFSSTDYYKILYPDPCRSLLFNSFMYSSVYMLILTLFIAPPTLPLG